MMKSKLILSLELQDVACGSHTLIPFVVLVSYAIFLLGYIFIYFNRIKFRLVETRSM